MGSRDKDKKDASSLLMAGGGVAALGVAGAVVGAACPLCVVAAPALIGAGLYKKWKARTPAVPAVEEANPAEK